VGFVQGVDMRKVRRVVVLAALAGGSVIGACGEDLDDTREGSLTEGAADDGLISGHVKEWEVVIESATLPAGTIEFSIENQGTIQHEFLVVKTDVDLGKIPVEGDRFSEEQESILMVDEIPEFEPGTTGKLVVDLEPGTYQLVCNIAGHYQAGMYTRLTVAA
jgi:uncharacterized cupredoxin-like copper-binding protein